MSTLSAFASACAYPNTDPSMFETHSLIEIDTGEILTCEEGLILGGTPFSKRLTGGLLDVPTYDIVLFNNNGKHLEERIAVMAIGSNCSPTVMLNKFKGKVGGNFLIAQAEIENHAVVHGAFLSKSDVQAPPPATIVPHQGTTTKVTIGFLSPEQAAVLTGTEWNYDVVQSGFAPKIRQGIGLDVQHGAAMYVSPWGALTVDGENPVALSAIPSETTLAKATTLEAMTAIAQILKQDDIESFFNRLPTEPEQRLRYIFKLQDQGYALPAVISGRPILKAAIGEDCRKIGRDLPQIAYL